MHPENLYSLQPLTMSHLAHGLPGEAIRVAMLFDGHRRLWEVLRDSCLSGRMTMSVVSRLATLGVIREVSGGWTMPSRDPSPWGTPVESAVAENAVAESAVAESAVAENAVAESAVAESAVAESAVAERAVAESAVAERAVAEAFAHTMEISTTQLPLSPVISGACPDKPRCIQAPPKRAQTEAALMTIPEAVNTAASFEEHEERFFASYEPEDDQVDTFWDLEDSPSKRLQARRRAQKRQPVRTQGGGWVRQLFSL